LKSCIRNTEITAVYKLIQPAITNDPNMKDIKVENIASCVHSLFRVLPLVDIMY